MNNNRTKKSAKNALFALFSKIIFIVLSFVCRTFFIKYLGNEYLGVNGLFTNILTILSFAELGIGNAIIFKLYKPIAADDKERIKTLVHFYKKAYIIIGVFIIVSGILVIPFLDYIIKDAPTIKESISLIYIIFLINTAISYFFTYKKSLIIAYQNEYILSLVDLIISIVQNILQIVFLIYTRNFVVYLLICIISTVLNNIIASIIANKKYKFIKDKNYKKITKKEQREIFNDVKSLVLYKFGYVLSNGTDNIIISSFIGVSQVGLLSNYTTITSAITSLLGSVFNSLTASIGNLNTINDNKKKEQIFYEILFISFLIYSVISVGIGVLSNKFITIWVGKECMLPFNISFAIAFNLYIDGMRFVNYTFRNTLGVFKKGRFIPLISSISNIVLSLILVKYIGMFGVLIATGITRLLILTWYDPYIIHKNVFKTSSKRYMLNYIYYLVVTAIAYVICMKIDSLVHIEGLLGFIVSGIIVTLTCAFIVLLSSIQKQEFYNTKQRIQKLLKRRIENV